MRQFLLGFSIAGAFALGCAAATTGVVPTPAQAEQPASYSGAGFTECFGATTWTVQGRELNAGELPKETVKIPAGWTPVGGGSWADSAYGYVLLCR
jgi:hypothetical protein